MWSNNFAPWEHYPKNLEWEEIESPMKVVSDFFASTDLLECHRDLKLWRDCVISSRIFPSGRHGPGTLLFLYDHNVKLLEAVFLLYLNYKNHSYHSKKYTPEEVEREKVEWAFYPGNLSTEEEINPYLACEQIFDAFSQQHYINLLKDWLQAALYNSPIDEGVRVYDIVAVSYLDFSQIRRHGLKFQKGRRSTVY